MKEQDRRVVITGEGIVSAIGNNKAEVLRSLREKRSGIGEMRFLNSAHKELPVGEVKMLDEEMKRLLDIPQSKLVSRTALMGMLAVRQALHDAGLADFRKTETASKAILVSGTTVGGMDLTEKHYKELKEGTADPELLSMHDCGSCTRQIAADSSCFSDSTTISTACSSAANALILGAELIKTGQADIVVAGGTEALTKFHLNGFNSLMILDHQPCRPFDAGRAGLNLGEGAAFVVMESEAHALQRKADIHAWLSGYANACDAFHQTASSENGEGAFQAMTEALAMAGLQPSDIQYVNAHGTGTPNNDQSESNALLRVFGSQMPMVSSTKGFTGHATSAAGGIEAVICLLAISNSLVPANLGWTKAMDSGVVPTMGEEHCRLTNVMTNSFGFGGNDSSLVFSAQPTENTTVAHAGDLELLVLAKVEINSVEALPGIAEFVKPLEARRMGKLMKSSLLSSLKALKEAGIECPDAVVTATAYGCLEYSEKLLEQMEEEGETSLKPTFFMQSTHNTVGSNIAIKTGCHGYNVTYTHGEQSMRWALRDAELLLKSGKCKTVLVGCHEETTPLFRQLMENAGIHLDYEVKSVAMVLSCGK